VSDHPVCGAKVGFAEIFFMPQPPLLTRVTTYLNQYGCWISDPPSPFVRYAMKICNFYRDIR
jgi:hypothetical protein